MIVQVKQKLINDFFLITTKIMMHAEAYLVQLCSLIEVGTERELKLNPGVETFENDKPTITRPNSVFCKVKQRSHWRTHTIYFFSFKKYAHGSFTFCSRVDVYFCSS